MLQPFSPVFFRQLQQLKIHTRRLYLGTRQGAHLSARRGHGLEFSDYRHYAAGDDFRHIDWNVYARTDRLYVRQFREEQELNVMLLLDTSNSMAYPLGEGKFDLMRRMALALGYVALSDGDTVTFALLGQKMTPRYIGPKALTRAWREIETAKPGGSFDFLNETRAAVSRLKIPGKCFVISDFMFAPETQFAALDLLRARNFDVSVLQVLGPSELKFNPPGASSVMVDSETQERVELALDRVSVFEYAKALANHIEELENYCRCAGIAHVLISSQESVSDVVLTRLPELGLLR